MKVSANVLVAGPTLSEGLEIQGWIAGLECKVAIATTAREVVRSARNQTVDLLILDTSLPEMEGAKLIPLLREVDPELPIIVTTRDHSPALEQAVRRCEVAFYAIRPDDLPYLREVARKNLEGVEKASETTGGR